MISVDDLIRRGFVHQDQRQELEQYMEARHKFGDIFGPGPDLIEDVTNKIGRCVKAYRQARGEFAGALEDAARRLADLEDRAIAPLEVLFADDAQAERVQGMNRLLQDAAAFCRLTPEDATGEFETFERKLQSIGEELQSFRKELFPKRAE